VHWNQLSLFGFVSENFITFFGLVQRHKYSLICIYLYCGCLWIGDKHCQKVRKIFLFIDAELINTNCLLTEHLSPGSIYTDELYTRLSDECVMVPLIIKGLNILFALAII